MMQDKIYLVMYSYYEDWQIYGFFTNRTDAEKYCVAHKDKKLYIKEIPNYDNIDEDFRNISLKYTFNIMFGVNEDGEFKGLSIRKFDWENDCVPYQDEFFKSNLLEYYHSFSWVRVAVNLDERNLEKAQKIAQDLVYQYLAMFDNKFSEKNIQEFNKILSHDEDERKEKKKQEKIREKELAELKRLQEKYKNEI